VKIDDAGLHLSRSQGAGAGLKRALGKGVLGGAPYLMKLLSIAGTAAMFLVGGGILVHGLPPLHHLSVAMSARAAAASPIVGYAAAPLFSAVAGIVIGGVVLGVVEGVKGVVKRSRRDVS
jgi:hypothetical protein